MKQLFDGRYPMWTHVMGFLEASVKGALDAIPIEASQRIEAWEDSRNLEEIVSAGRTTQPILVPTRSGWLGYFRYDLSSLNYVPMRLSERGRFRAVLIRAGTDSRTFSLYRRGKIVRALQVLNEGGRWTFHQDGDPLPFENLDAYQRPRISDRFNGEMLEAYCAALGLRPFDADFYLPTGVVKVEENPTVLPSLLRFLRRKTTVRRIR